MSDVNIYVRSEANGKNNEDASFSVSRGKRSILCVADGVGGTDAGEIASGYVTKNLERWADENDINRLGRQSLHNRVCEFVNEMHSDLITIGDNRDLSLGTTFIMAVVGLNQVVIETIGDSRAYIFQRGYLKQITLDQTVRMREMVEGVIEEDIPERKKDSTLLQCIGDGPKDPVPVQYAVAVDEDVDILLCSDGLSNKLNELNIQSQLAKSQSGDNVLDNLISLAKKRGEKDNITAVLYRRRKSQNKR